MTLRALLHSRHLPFVVTVTLFLLMFGAGSLCFENFLSGYTLSNLVHDNAHLGIIAVGMTLVILSGEGGIDLSVGAVMALSTVLLAKSLSTWGLPLPVALAFVLVVGAALGLIMGWMIQAYQVPPFIATLAGMFFARGVCFLIDTNAVAIDDEVFRSAAMNQWELPAGGYLSVNMVIFFVVVLAAMLLAHKTRTGRTLYARGGSAASAKLMGLPVARTTILVYALSGTLSALAGIVFALYMLSGHGNYGLGLELDAIAVTVMGGTLLSGGIGTVAGTFVGTLIYGTIQQLITFLNLNTWWTKMIIGLLIFLFIVFQTGMNRTRQHRTAG